VRLCGGFIDEVRVKKMRQGGGARFISDSFIFIGHFLRRWETPKHFGKSKSANPTH
jgi:hypothetical protein